MYYQEFISPGKPRGDQEFISPGKPRGFKNVQQQRDTVYVLPGVHKPWEAKGGRAAYNYGAPFVPKL